MNESLEHPNSHFAETEGGHSFGAFGNRNAIYAMADLVCRLYEKEVPVCGDSHTTYNVGIVEGGTSVNTIAQNCKLLYEYRSDSAECLADMQAFFEETIEKAKKAGKSEITVNLLGVRPCEEKVLISSIPIGLKIAAEIILGYFAM